MNKKEYYVNLHAGEISESPHGDKKHYKIHATKDEIRLLRAKMENMRKKDQDSFWRAHVPFMPYEQNNPNDAYDAEMMEAFQMIYTLGDEQARKELEQMNVFSEE